MQRLRRKKPAELDGLFREEHESAFEVIDCLECANCCKTTGPKFTSRDIERIAKYIGMKGLPGAGRPPPRAPARPAGHPHGHDYVLNSSPCVFLQDDNKCSIYEHRPRACREYPHTDRKNMHQILNLTRKNTEVCPAVSKMVESIKANVQ